MVDHMNSVHSAVLGMLGLSQQYASDVQQVPVLSNGQQMPLTPPGSPEEQLKLAQQQQQASCVYNNEPKPNAAADEQRMNAMAGLAHLPTTSNHSVHGTDVSANAAGYAGAYDVFGAFNQLTAAKSDFLGAPLITGGLPSAISRRNRSEKKPIPEHQKDNKYFERRQKNNNAAKRSRDNRKRREDDIAMKAALLERENAVLRAQVTTLRDEASNLRTLQFQKQQSHMLHAHMMQQQHGIQHNNHFGNGTTTMG